MARGKKRPASAIITEEQVISRGSGWFLTFPRLETDLAVIRQDIADVSLLFPFGSSWINLFPAG